MLSPQGSSITRNILLKKKKKLCVTRNGEWDEGFSGCMSCVFPMKKTMNLIELLVEYPSLEILDEWFEPNSINGPQ